MKTRSLLGDILRNRRRATNLPRYLTYIVTWTCNARCIMCDSWKKESPDDLNLAEIEGIFRQLPRLDAVRLTGGEPFVRADLAEIARLAVEILDPRFLHITTNGFLTQRIIEFCERRDIGRPLRLLVSLDGLASKHNHVRGRDSAWATAFATVSALAPRQAELNVQLSVNQTVVDAEGKTQYRQLRELLRPLGVRLNLVMAYDASATYSLRHDSSVAASQIGRFTTFGELDSAGVGELADEVERDLASFPLPDRLAKRYYWRGIRARLTGGSATPNPPCVALNSHLRLLPNGDVPVCQFNARKVGNLRRQSFQEVWFGPAIDAERAWVRKCPGCWAECEVLPSAVYTGDILRAVI
jgi:MoaA/NifB/PqqE/SkfB family radical SAM enzyme